MFIFTTERGFLLPSFGPLEEEGERIRRFMLFLESSGVGAIIGRYVKNGSARGVRPSVNDHRLFAAILHGFATGRATLRRRGMKRASTEITLNALGMTIAKLFRFYETGATTDNWQAPPGLAPQEFKKPSAKRLSKKAKRYTTEHANGGSMISMLKNPFRKKGCQLTCRFFNSPIGG